MRVVVLMGYTPLKERTWFISRNGRDEANRLAEWLTLNGHKAMSASMEQWKQMEAGTFKDWPSSWGWSG